MTTKAVRCLALPAGLAMWLVATAAFAQTFSREQDIPDLRLGQRVMVVPGGTGQGSTGLADDDVRRASHPQVHSEARDKEAIAIIVFA